ncbi:MAG: IS3 family transposase [Holdemanella porci]
MICCFEYIETFYNTIRIHSHCGYESPNQYENNYYSKHSEFKIYLFYESFFLT